MKLMKKMLAVLLAATLTVGCFSVAMADDTDSASTTVTVKSATVAPAPVKADKVTATEGSKVSTTATGTATLSAVGDTKSKKITVDKVTVDGIEYTVTTINANAFKKASATTVTLGAGIKKVAKNAFARSKVKTVELKGTKSISFAKYAFKNSKVKTIKVNKKMSAKEYKKLVKALKKAGYKGKIKKVKMK